MQIIWSSLAPGNTMGSEGIDISNSTIPLESLNCSIFFSSFCLIVFTMWNTYTNITSFSIITISPSHIPARIMKIPVLFEVLIIFFRSNLGRMSFVVIYLFIGHFIYRDSKLNVGVCLGAVQPQICEFVSN